MNDAPTEEGRQWLTDMDMTLVCELATGNFYVATSGGEGKHLILCDASGEMFATISYQAKHLIRPLTDVEMADQILFNSDLIQLRDSLVAKSMMRTTWSGIGEVIAAGMLNREHDIRSVK